MLTIKHIRNYLFSGSLCLMLQGKRIKIFKPTTRYSESYHPKPPSNVFS